MLRIFISSTSQDLPAHREAVRKAVTALKMYPVMMEDFTAMDSNAVEKCHHEVLDCDIFIGIYAYRYGFIPPDETKSITQLEYEWATQAHKPRLIYVVDPAYDWSAALRDDDPAPMAQFKQHVGLERVWKTFTSPESLAAVVTQGLAELERPVTLRAQRRQLVASVIGIGVLLVLLFTGLTFVLQQQQVALKLTPTITPTPIATAITAGTNREVLVVLTKFDQVAGSDEDPAAAWELTMQKPIHDLKSMNVRIVRYDSVIRTEEEAKALAAQLKATIVIWGWTYSDVSLTTNYTIAPQWSRIDTQLDETQVNAAPDQKIDVTIARGADTEYVLNFVLEQLEYFGGDDTDALPYFDRCIQIVPAERQTGMGLAAIYLYHGVIQQDLGNDSDQALADFTKAIQLDPKFPTAYYNRGVVNFEQQNYDDALTDYTKVIQLDPNSSDAYTNRGLTYYNQQVYDKALADESKAIQLDPSNANAYYDRGNVYNKQQRYQDALADYAKAIQFEPSDPSVYNNRGVVYHHLNDYDNALTNFNWAIQLDPNRVNPFINRGNVYYDQQKYDEALADYSSAIQLDPTHASAYLSRGDAYEALKRYQEALADFQQYTTLVPDDPDGLQAIQDVEALLGTLTPTP